ncbi:MAG: NADH:flavin oxidoreductase [Minicystis sp.]
MVMPAQQGRDEERASDLEMFKPFRIKNVAFKNRILRSAMGGKMAYYDGTPNNAWKNFERRFARHGVGGIISTTLSVDPRRIAPLEYPSLSHDRFVPAYKAAIREIREAGAVYIVQVGDPGYHTQGGLFSQKADGRTSSAIFDLLYGYRSTAGAMSEAEIAHSVVEHAEGVRRAREAGADGVEITASKGYLIHQFLNPGINRRDDRYGGSPENRFRFLEEIVTAARKAVGDDFMIGVRLSAIDYNYLPVNIRFPIFPTRRYLLGNGLDQTIPWAQKLETMGINYLHVTRGFGFINPKENPGDYPLDQIRIFGNAVRHLSAKAWFRAALLNTIPGFLLRPFLGMGWKKKLGENAEYAAKFKQALKIPVLVNGGFQSRDLIEDTLKSGKADMITMARPLLANPDLLEHFKKGKAGPEKPCTFCNRCVIFTAVHPVGCYDPSRFKDQDEMEKHILAWSGNPEPFAHALEKSD